MENDEIFLDSTNSSGDIAGVYEYDGSAGYFYLYKLKPGQPKILGAIKITSMDSNKISQDITIKWDRVEENVGLYISGELWAAFDTKAGTMFGGNYSQINSPNIPNKIKDSFMR